MASHKLKKLQTIRRIEREDAAEQLFDQTVAAELNNINFAEQSQKPAFDGKSEIRNERGLRREFRGTKPITRLRREIRSTKSEIRNVWSLRRKFRRTKPICAGLNGLNVFYGTAL